MDTVLGMMGGALMSVSSLWVVNRFKLSRTNCVIVGFVVGLVAHWLDGRI